MDRTLLLVPLIVVGVAVAMGGGGTPTGQLTGSPLAAAADNPAVQTFRNHTDVVNTSIYRVPAETVRERSRSLQQLCGAALPQQPHWKVVFDAASGHELTAWIGPSGNVTCTNRVLFPDLRGTLFGVHQPRQHVTFQTGETFQERLYIYSFRYPGDLYIDVDVLERPDWGDFSITPATRTYTPVGAPAVTMNVKVSGRDPVLVPRDESDAAYFQLPERTGYIPASAVTIRQETPTPHPVTHRGVTGDFTIRLNLTAKHVVNGRMERFRSEVVAYDLTVTPHPDAPAE